MRRPSPFIGALLGAITALPLMGLFFLGAQLTGWPFVPFDFFDWLARTLPGSFITLFIDTMVKAIQGLSLDGISEAAKSLERIAALVVAVICGALFGVLLALVLGSGRWSGRQAGLAGGFLLFLLIAFLEWARGFAGNPLPALIWTALLTLGWGVVLGASLERAAVGVRAPEEGAEYQAGRRVFLVRLAGVSLGVALASWGLGRLLEAQGEATGASRPLSAPAGGATPVEAVPPGPSGRIEPAPGTRPEVTPNQQFYRIDIDLRPPTIAADSWSLEVKGLFDHPRRLGLSDLMAYPAVTQPITLACISNPIGGDLIGTSYWTGVRLVDLLRDLGLRPEARELYLEAADGFFESVAMADLGDPRTLLVYGMNGATLPVEHGFPLRIYIPNRYGMKQPKWITSMEAIDREGAGYWVERGWSKEARPQILSIIDSVGKDQEVDGRVPVGGIAWAGDRGIQKVEVQVDDGPWEDAALRIPPLSPLTWVQWRYDWSRVPGRHLFRVRATDGTGALQIEQVSDVHPDGATGYHTVTVTI